MIISAAAPCPPPPWLEAKRKAKRGPRALGLAYEALVAKALPGTLHGQWFTYRQGLGPKAWCQPDLIWLGPKDCLILECKLTDTPGAKTQLEFYAQVVALSFGLPAFGLTICKNLTPKSKLVTTSLASALELARSGLSPTLHWRGETSLVPHMAPGLTLAPSREPRAAA